MRQMEINLTFYLPLGFLKQKIQNEKTCSTLPCFTDGDERMGNRPIETDPEAGAK